MASECTQEAVLRYLIENGGRVKNRELIDHFKVTVSLDPTTKTTFKEALKRFVDNVAFVKQENGEKFVCLKKKYREGGMQTVVRDDGECNGNGLPADVICPSERNESSHINGATHDLDNGNEPSPLGTLSENCVQNRTSNLNMTLGLSSMENEGRFSSTVNDVAEKKVSDVHFETRDKVSGAEDEKTEDISHIALNEGKRLITHDSTTSENVKLDMTVNVRPVSELTVTELEDGTTEETAAIRQVQSSPNPDTANEIDTESAVIKGPSISVVNRRRTSRGSQRSLLALSEDGMNEAVFDLVNSGDSNTPKSSRKNFIELMMSSSPQVRRTLVHRNSQSNIAVRNRESIRSEGDTASLLSSADEDCTAVMLDPLEHEWMMCASDGQWESLQQLLVCDPNLVTKRDFVTGFTCLHWAAKQGNQELLAKLVSFAKEHDIPVNINARSSAGYTPLHLAAMHSHVEAMKLLVGAFDADVEVRDYSGKKASQYLSSSVAGDIKDIIGASSDSDVENAESGAGRWRLPKVLPSNLNPLRLLNHPDDAQGENAAAVKPRSLYRKASIGRIKLNRSRFKTQIVHSTSFRETDEGEGSLKSPVKTRPVSNLFG
ncbi:ankyrin repeat domain-containing protein SOWAHC [Alosa sapidissima]|uniref:ankyrin repeat domain-containing protein SOWAHC n=1 Tax=Alosa sapidissima TaxID=34773 RepID=UPI001C08C05A|nr:ankyrin repeat domain-containing protein SOWAHC [Alosa sapidissima]